jgi:hypothetical protein
MKKLAVLEYTFLFEPEETWQHLFQFEKDLTDFFKSKGKELQVVKTIEGATTGRRIVLIAPLINQVPLSMVTKPSPNPSIKSHLDKLRNK